MTDRFNIIADEVDELLRIESDNLDGESIKNSRIFTKIQKMYTSEARELRKLLQNQDKVNFLRWRRYAGKASDAELKEEPMTFTVLKGDIDKYMAIDEQVVEMKNLVADQDRIVKFLEDATKRVKDRGYDIKSAIDFRRLIMVGS